MSKYMINVMGNNSPKKVHDDKELALIELDRLANQSQNVGKEIHLMKIVKTVKSRIEVEEV